MKVKDWVGKKMLAKYRHIPITVVAVKRIGRLGYMVTAEFPDGVFKLSYDDVMEYGTLGGFCEIADLEKRSCEICEENGVVEMYKKKGHLQSYANKR